MVPAPSPPFRSRWALTLPHANQVLVAGGPVNFFVGTDTTPLRAYTVAHGRPAWHSTLKPDFPMAAGDDLVFVPQGDSIHALDQATGNERWVIATGPLAVPPVWQPQWLFTSAKDGTLTAWRVADGAPIWKQPLGSPASARMSVDGDHLFAGLQDKRLVCLRISDAGKLLWTTSLHAVAGEITAIAGRLYFGAADYTFYSVKQGAGEFEWPPHRSIHSTVVGRPVVDADHIWIATLNNRADALSRGNGEIDLIRTISSRPGEQLLIEGGEVIVPLESGDLRFFRQKDGELYIPPAPVVAAPAPTTPPPPSGPARVAARFPLFTTLPAPDGETHDGGVAFANPTHAAAPSPAGSSLKAALLLAGPPAAPVLLKVTIGPDAVHTVTAYERDKRLNTRTCVFEWASCESRTLGLPIR